MPLREDLRKPVPGDNPGGVSLRYDPVYDKIKEARRQDDDLSQGAWQIERKLADYPAVIKLAQDAIATRSKDLQLVAWLTEALIKEQGFAGLRDGLKICYDLVDQFWDHLYPELEDGDAEPRSAPLTWIGTKLDVAVKGVPLVKSGLNWFIFKESRALGYESQATTSDQKKAREKALKEGKTPAEAFDKAFAETPKFYYLQLEKDLDAALQILKDLDKLCDEKFQDAAPTLGPLRSASDDVRQTVHSLLQKKRETEPDPVEEPAPAPAGETPAEAAEPAASPAGFTAAVPMAMVAAAEPADRREAVASVVAAAAFLRKREPRSPAPYLMLRGLRWGELRAAAAAGDQTPLEAPPTELRRQVKSLAMAGKWKDMLEAAENAMALPCSRAWLDLQRLAVDACQALGSDYFPIAAAICSEVRALLRDVPQLLTATLMDDTPAANPETQAWIREMIQPDAPAAASAAQPAWPRKPVDSNQLADEALKAGQQQKALEILNRDLAQQTSGRGRFMRKLQIAQLCIAAGKEAIAQPLLEDLAAAIDANKLEDWEDREFVAAALATILKSNKRIQADAKEKQKYFERICRLDPSQALNF